MSKFLPYFVNLLLLCEPHFASANGDQILGCGGFVKSKANIDYSKVEVRLITLEGIQKYQTECAPNNGYYMVPFIENGDFILKIQPPDGWIFEPSAVNIHVDGKNDPCSQGKDINFEFMGFSVKGQVRSLGLETGGPAGVILQLKQEGSTEPVTEVFSSENGAFEFRAVLPGRYKISAAHKTFTFQQEEISVDVMDDTMHCAQPIIVSGYNIHGKVTAADLPAANVHLLLFSPHKVHPQIERCQKTPPTGSDDLLKMKGFHFICSVTSDSNGAFTFSTLQPSEYILMPFHKGGSIEFDVEPKLMKFTISHGDLILPETFKVAGFSVTGLVLDSAGAKGRPVPGAEVMVDGVKQAVTNQHGQYRLQSMTTGIYKITLLKEDFTFPASTVRIGPDTPRLPNIVAEKFSLCGQALIRSIYLKSFNIEQVEVHAKTDNNGGKLKTSLDSNGHFCFQLSPGDYTLEPVVLGASQSSLQFQPSQSRVTLVNAPMKDVKFQQLLLDVEISVSCIGDCLGARARMLKDGEPASAAVEKKVTGPASLHFQNLLPGRYHFTSLHEQWCWEKNQTTIDIGLLHGKKNVVVFKQTGFKLICSVSHDIDMVIYHHEKPANALRLTKGKNELCVAEAGEYVVKPKSCHVFTQKTYKFNTANPQPLLLQAVAHVFSIKVLSNFKDPQLTFVVVSSIKAKETTLTPELEKRSDAQEFSYATEYQATDTEELTITPSSPILLFEPKTHTISIRSVDCARDAIVFKAFKGLFIEGTVAPPIKNVLITIHHNEAIDSPAQCFTNSTGHYKYGPVDPRLIYTITAHKEGYAFLENTNKKGYFQARKYSKISFSVEMNDENSLPLKGVFITISGGSFRSNNLTDAEGNLVLFNLEPGQYYFKAVMKEYEFLPSSKVIELSEGEEMNIKIKGKRVAFSCYGSVQSLNGHPEPEASIQAFEDTEDGDHAEETKSDENGIFRIKGLLPHTDYRITVKQQHYFERFTPQDIKISVGNEDVTDVKFIAFRKQSQFEILGNVNTDYTYHKSLKVALYKSSDMNAPISTVSLSHSPFFHFPALPRDNGEYQVVLETTLDNSKYTFTEPAARFYAAGAYKHITLEFHPQIKTLDMDTPQASYLTLPLGLLVLLLVYNYSKVQVLLESLYAGKVSGSSEASKQSGRKLRKEK